MVNSSCSYLALILCLFHGSRATDSCSTCTAENRVKLCTAATSLKTCYGASSNTQDSIVCSRNPANGCQKAVWEYLCSPCSETCLYLVSCLTDFPSPIKWHDGARDYWQNHGCTIPTTAVCTAVNSGEDPEDTSGTGGDSSSSGTSIGLVSIVIIVMVIVAAGAICARYGPLKYVRSILSKDSPQSTTKETEEKKRSKNSSVVPATPRPVNGGNSNEDDLDGYAVRSSQMSINFSSNKHSHAPADPDSHGLNYSIELPKVNYSTSSFYAPQPQSTPTETNDASEYSHPNHAVPRAPPPAWSKPSLPPEAYRSNTSWSQPPAFAAQSVQPSPFVMSYNGSFAAVGPQQSAQRIPPYF